MISAPLRVSPLREQLAGLRSTAGVVQGMTATLDLSGDDAAGPNALALADASAFPRFGVCGPGAADWLQARDVPLPEVIFGTAPMAPDGLCIRMGRTEFVLEDGPEGSVTAALARELGAGGDGVYAVTRQEAQILLRGRGASDVLAQVCGVNFREPGDRLVMTRLAGVSGSVLAQGGPEEPWFRIWVDPTFAEYLWRTLLIIVRDAGGGVAGLASFFPRCKDIAQQPDQAEEHPR